MPVLRCWAWFVSDKRLDEYQHYRWDGGPRGLDPPYKMMLTILTLLAIIVTVPIVVLCLECMAALLPARRIARATNTVRPTIDVLIPAHDEATVIAATLSSVTAQLLDGDRVSVVADNCSDSRNSRRLSPVKRGPMPPSTTWTRCDRLIGRRGCSF